ncbi:YolD-like family protein [Mesobacillus foraminis]|uniref:YolD-like family protein n=1 Tax=Mesobacillus foraminis TaxID=279826 RepID=UPI001BE7CE5E|nr:YolD-like family protein [Mesobacillus foraminis]MBT2757557.1 YolD-like family protein [Mesobacillus foraminis]
MAIRDRGKLKWLPAHFMPEHRSFLREMQRDQLRKAKPLIDEYELEDFERRICEAMEFNQRVVISKWTDGFIIQETGRVHYLDPIRKEIRMVSEDGTAFRIEFADITDVKIQE